MWHRPPALSGATLDQRDSVPMDVAVLPLFALFFTALVVTTTSKYDVLRVSIRRPRAFQLAAIGAAAVTVPVDLYALGYDATGPAGASLQDVAARLLLLNVAVACGLASLHGALRVPSDDGHGMGVLGWSGPLIALVVVTAVVALGSGGNGSSPDGVGSTAGSAGAALAIYSLLVCVISASSLFRRRVRSAIDPQEG